MGCLLEDFEDEGEINNNENNNANNVSICCCKKEDNRLQISNEQKREIRIDKTKFKYIKEKDYYNSIIDELLEEYLEDQREIIFEECYTYELQEIQVINKEIFIKIKEQLGKYLSSEKDYMIKKAHFLKNVGILVRFCHELAIFVTKKLFEIFENKKYKITQINFAKWTKYCLNAENFFPELAEKINIIEIIKVNNKDKNFFVNVFPELIKLYFYCYLADIVVKIVYAKKGDVFDWDTMVDNLLTMQDDKKVLFTYLPGLYSNSQFFENAHIYVVTYTEDNPNKFKLNNYEFEDVNQSYLNAIKSKNVLLFGKRIEGRETTASN